MLDYEMMWKEFKEKITTLQDEDGLVILADIEELIEVLEIEWTKSMLLNK